MRSPNRPVLVLAGMVLLAAVVMWAGWHGTEVTSAVPFQIPVLMSGGTIGLGLLGMAVTAWTIHLSRREDDQLRAETAAVMHELVASRASAARTGPRRRERRNR